MTDELTIRLHYVESDGTIRDAQMDYGIESFAGVLPSIGDEILDPGVLQGKDRRDPENRTIWKVVRRIFNPRDLDSYVALVVEERVPTHKETDLV